MSVESPSKAESLLQLLIGYTKRNKIIRCEHVLYCSKIHIPNHSLMDYRMSSWAYSIRVLRDSEMWLDNLLRKESRPPGEFLFQGKVRTSVLQDRRAYKDDGVTRSNNKAEFNGVLSILLRNVDEFDCHTWWLFLGLFHLQLWSTFHMLGRIWTFARTVKHPYRLEK